LRDCIANAGSTDPTFPDLGHRRRRRPAPARTAI